MKNETKDFIEFLETMTKFIDECKERVALDELEKQLAILEEEIKKEVKTKENKKDCQCKTEKLKTFEECTLGEKFILYLLEKNKIHVSEDIIEDAEALIYNNPVLDFLIMHDKDILDNLNALLNSLYEVNLEKLRVKKG